jgi:hypothetical protein
MAYDFGSQTLGIKNPFKVEGLFYSISGLLILAGGILPLLKVADLIKIEPVTAYGYAVLGASTAANSTLPIRNKTTAEAVVRLIIEAVRKLICH